MDLTVTSAVLALGVVLTAFFGWMGARPVNISRGPRLIPYRLLMLLTAALVTIVGAHEAALLGAPVRP